MDKILLNDILKIQNLADVKIRFNLQMGGNYNPIDTFDKNNLKKFIDGHYWNYPQRKSFKLNQRTLGFIPYDRKDNTWLLFHAGKVIQDLNVYDGVGYVYKDIEEFSKYCGRLIIRYKNKSRNPIFKAETCINNCEVVEILPDIYDDDAFPGYENVNISWEKLSRVIKKESWKTALQNQKGVYLITDTEARKMYVGSAYGENMLLGRWTNYVETYHGGNVELKKLKPSYIQSNFRYSILEVFKATTDDEVIIKRESWWKNVLMTKDFGYNKN